MSLIRAIGDACGAAGGVAAIIAVLIARVQVKRDRAREDRELERLRFQEVTRARSAKLLMGAFYASAINEVRYLTNFLSNVGDTSIDAREQAGRLRDDQHLAIIFQALITIDATTLSTGALKPVGDAQVALIAWHNVIAGLAAGRRNHEAKHRLPKLMQDIKTAYEQMRGEVPFELDV
jgi:hypothetical protein